MKMKRIFICLFALLGVAQGIWAETYVTEMITVAGGKSSVKDCYVSDGWILAGGDLNKGAGGDYVYLLYKTGTNPDEAITDVYITINEKNTHPATIVQGGRTYYQVQGGHDLNKGAGGYFIFLYYTTADFANGRKLTSLVVNGTYEGAEGFNGQGNSADLNYAIKDSDFLYLHAYATAPRGIITDMMLIGSGSRSEFNALKQQYAAEGWWIVDIDLNEGAGGNYINLLYKTVNESGNSGIPITDLYIKKNGDHPKSLVSDNRTYYLVPGGGNSAFNNSGCDLNDGAGGDYIYLYYTKDAFQPGRAVDKIKFVFGSNAPSGAVGAGQSSTEGIDFNSGIAFSTRIYIVIGTTAATNRTAQAIWCEGNSTLYFINDNTLYNTTNNNIYKNQTVTQVWSAASVTSTPQNDKPVWWNVVKDYCKNVIFQNSFRDVRPTSLSYWFNGMKELETVTGIEYLNTSEVTHMSMMFASCSKLKTIDVGSFDVSKVESATSMFSGCTQLTTIYCNNNWGKYLEGHSMFYLCLNLLGAVRCDGEDHNNVDARRYANPTTGFFTGNWNVETRQTEHVTLNTNATSAYTNKTVTVQVTPDAGYPVAGIKVTGMRTGSPVSVTDNGNNTYSFQMPAESVVVSAKKYEPVAVWCQNASTLYFAYAPAPLPGDEFMGQTVTAAWSGDDVTALSDDSPRPKWNLTDGADANTATCVVFDSSFATVKPTNLSGWFYHMTNLSTIEGIEYLNTSAAYKISSMFGGATKLTILDLNGFDVGNVTTADYMFNGCSSLTTIYCDNNWSFLWESGATSEQMFYGCSNLVGAEEYSALFPDGSMANPSTGYFTGNWYVYLYEPNYVTLSISSLKLYPNETVTITVTDELKLYVNEVESDRALKNIVAKGMRTGQSIPVTDNKDNSYTFTMPSENVNVSVEEKTPYTIYNNGVMRLADATPYNGQKKLTSGWYAVSDGYWSLSDRLEVWGDVNLILCDGVTLFNPKGCSVNSTSKLTVWGQQKGNGKWIINSPEDGFAGIGGDNMEMPGYIVINGGDIEATGGKGAAGIGAGYQLTSLNYPENAGRIDINFGVVKATGGENAAGIGNGTGRGVNAKITLSAGYDYDTDQAVTASSYAGTIVLKNSFSDGENVYDVPWSANEVDYTEQAAQLAGKTLTPVHEIFVYEDTDNSETLKMYSGTYCTVGFDERPLYKDGNWQTLCLPFAVPNIAGTALDGATVKTLESATFQNGTLTLTFSEDLTAIEAGKPYIVKFERPYPYVPWDGFNNECSDIVNPIFYNGKIIETPIDIECEAATFHGIFDPYSTGGEDKTILYLGAGNKLYYPSGDMTIGAFRAYFQLNSDITAGDPNGVRAFVLNFGDETSDATRLNDKVKMINDKEAGAWYDLQGRRMAHSQFSILNSQLKKGVYIHGGRKVVIP